MPQHEYPHLKFVGKEVNRARLGGGGNASRQTRENRENRNSHATHLRQQLGHVNAWWEEEKKRRQAEGHPEVDGIPLWVQIDPKEQSADFLRNMGFTLISQEENGFVLVASNAETFVVSGQKIDDFLDTTKQKNGKPASIYEIGQPETESERINRILPSELQQTWQLIGDSQLLIVDLSISCDVKQPSSFDPQREDETDEHFAVRSDKREARIAEMVQKLDEVKREREEQLERFVHSYEGQIVSIFDDLTEVDFPDSFTSRVSICGQGFKDLVRSFQYLFQVENLEDVEIENDDTEAGQLGLDIAVIPPADGAASVCVIDSGMQEEHRLLKDGVKHQQSCNFIPGGTDSDTADYVAPVGHGTQVAGCVLFPYDLPESGDLELQGFVQNARILDKDNKLPDSVMPAIYVDTIVSHYHEKYNTRIFNHSINGSVPYRNPHMSTWAAAIDKISYLNDVLLVQSAGNVGVKSADPVKYGVQNHLQAGRNYPDYLHEASCRIANPAQSFQSLVVGSVSGAEFNDDYRSSIAEPEQSSSFSRSGPGIWGSLKPEVVEVGGDLVCTDISPPMVSQHPDLAPRLIQSTLHGQAAVGQSSVGTSISAPRVAGLAMQLQNALPEESALLYRALIANSARWPSWAEVDDNPCKVLHRIGYGLPDHERALNNDPYRVTLIISNEDLFARQAKLFKVPVPDKLRAVESSYDIRVDITLSYSAMPRRTRRGHRQYLSCRLDWKCSTKDQSDTAFRNDLFVTGADDRFHGDFFPWKLRDRDDYGIIQGPETSRQCGTLQKDWAVIASHELPEDFLIGVVGHPGWDNCSQYPAKFALAVSFESINKDIEIYEDVKVELEKADVDVERPRVTVEALREQMELF